jgi:hypothetical protein
VLDRPITLRRLGEVIDADILPWLVLIVQ